MSDIGFGTWSWGNRFLWGYNPLRDDYVLKETFKTAISAGLNLIDTADSYGTGAFNGRSESLLGEFIQDLPPKDTNNLIVATKLAPFPWRLGRRGLDKAFSQSKKRLRGKLDRAQLHWSTSRYAPWQESQLIDGLGDLVEKKLVSEIGVSNFGPNKIKLFHQKLSDRGIKLKSLQIQMSLLSPPDKRIINICRELNIDLIAYSPLALGALCISPEDEVPKTTILRSRLFKQLLPKSEALRREIKYISLNNDSSPAQVAINWCKSLGAKPIPGIRSVEQALDISRALSWDLTKKEVKKLNDLSSNCKARMPQNPFCSD